MLLPPRPAPRCNVPDADAAWQRASLFSNMECQCVFHSHSLFIWIQSPLLIAVVHEIKCKVFLIIFINTPFFLITIYVQDTKQIKSTLSLISVVGTQ